MDGVNSTFVGYGPETLIPPPDFVPGISDLNVDGGHFALELTEVPPNSQARALDPNPDPNSKPNPNSNLG